jgi:regulator of nucleoside diphosphate kinase
MVAAKLTMNAQDRRRLREAIESARKSWRTYGPYLDWLRSRLEEADTFEPTEVPQDVVTMNSRVELQDLRTGQTRSLRLVYPDQPQHGGDEVSVFDPPGLALLGSRVGDVLGWSDDEAVHTARVRRLEYQPEAAGDLDL